MSLTIPREKHKRTTTGHGPSDRKSIELSIPKELREMWKKLALRKFTTKEEFQREIIRHVETTIGHSLYNYDELAAFSAAALAFRDRLVIDWNATQQRQTFHDGKRVYYFSSEYLMGRALDNAILNTKMSSVVEAGMADLGFRVEDITRQERDAGLGNGGLGRLAACILDAGATLNMPMWGYGLRYRYGIFKQQVVDGNQIELPDYWLDFNPWEFQRPDVVIDVQFYGRVRKYKDEEGKTMHKWHDGEIVQALAHDIPIPGFDTITTNNLRLWSSRASTGEFDFQKFDAGDYESAVADQQNAETISAVLYPNDDLDRGRELRLKQQYLWCAASLSDIIRRFKKSERSWREFSDQVAIQLNGTHPVLAIVELQRILVDLEGFDWDEAWVTVTRTFNYTSHSTTPEVKEKWPVPLVQKLLPRHLQLLKDINYLFLENVKKRFPDDPDLLTRVSIFEETDPKTIRMLHLAAIGSAKINGVSELHSDLIKNTVLKDFVKIFGPDKFTNVTNGVTPRRWLHQANPKLSELIASKLGSHNFLKDSSLLCGLEKYADDKEFRRNWAQVKADNKIRLATYIKNTTGISVDPTALFDIQSKWIQESKRQQLNIFGIIHRYLKIKAMSVEERSRVVPRVSIFAGKAAPGYWMAKKIIHFITKVATVINKDIDTGDLLKVIFLEDYNVSKAEIICPASDISQHISTPGTEASGTSNMKFALNGGLIVCSWDCSNIEIVREIGEDNVFMFGYNPDDVEEVRRSHAENPNRVDPELQSVFDAIRGGLFGSPGPFTAIISSVVDQGDYHLVSDEFESYIKAQDMVDEQFRDYDKWLRKCILTVSRMGFFSADRVIDEYSESIWNIEPVPFGTEIPD